jgi:hypothetical protein
MGWDRGEDKQIGRNSLVPACWYLWFSFSRALSISDGFAHVLDKYLPAGGTGTVIR